MTMKCLPRRFLNLTVTLPVLLLTNCLMIAFGFFFYTNLPSSLPPQTESLKNVRVLLQDTALQLENDLVTKGLYLNITTNAPVLSNLLNTTHPRPESRSRSVAFLKAFKVGGTTISSLLLAYAFNTHQKIERIDFYCREGKEFAMKFDPSMFLGSPYTHFCIISGRPFNREGHCVDIVGADHPKQSPCNYPKIQSNSFCNPVEVFMMLRDPVERLWSGYKHEVRIAGKPFPLSRYLLSSTIVKTPSHHLLAKDVPSALRRTSDIHILLHHLYDESLVYMALRTGMKLCDIMYVPCDQASWGATKCNTKTNLTITDSDRAELVKEVTSSGEQEFYLKLVDKAEAKLKSPEVARLTMKYRRVRSMALKRCTQPGVLSAIEELLKYHPYIKQSKGTEKLWHYQVELTNPLDPLTICLGWYCNAN